MGGGEDRQWHVAEPVDDALNARTDVPGDDPGRWWSGSGDPVEVVALLIRQSEGDRERPEELRRRILGATLLEPDDVVHADAGEGGELLAAQADSPSSWAGGETDFGRGDPFAPGPEHTGEFVHPAIVPPAAVRILVLPVLLSTGAWRADPAGRSMDP